MFWFPLQTLCLCLHRGTPLLCVCLCIVLWVCSCAWYCYGKKVYGIKIILSFFNARPVIYCGYLELCFVSASIQCFFSPRFVHSFFHVWKTSNFYFTYCTYLLSLCLSWEMCLFICVCVCPTCKSCPLPKQTVQWIISHVRRRVRHVIRLKWISFLCVSVSGCVSMYVYDT